MAWYVVHVVRVPGIYLTWEDCYHEVNHYPGALYKKYNTKVEALVAYYGARSANALEIGEKPPAGDMKIRRLPFWSWSNIIIVFKAMVIAFLIWKLMSTLFC